MLGREDDNRLWRVRTPIGDLVVASDEVQAAGASVAISIRPEDVELSEAATDEPSGNCFAAIVDQKVFLGDFVDFQVVVNGVTLLSRTHPSLRTPVGDRIFVRAQPQKCIVLASDQIATRAA